METPGQNMDYKWPGSGPEQHSLFLFLLWIIIECTENTMPSNMEEQSITAKNMFPFILEQNIFTVLDLRDSKDNQSIKEVRYIW